MQAEDGIRDYKVNGVQPCSLPFSCVFLYGSLNGVPECKHKALHLLEGLPPERNAIIKGWEKLGIEVTSAYQTQALLQLKNEYCSKKRCLQCAVGGAILK